MAGYMNFNLAPASLTTAAPEPGVGANNASPAPASEGGGSPAQPVSAEATQARGEIFQGQFDHVENRPPASRRAIRGAKTSLEGEGKYDKGADGKWRDTGKTVSAAEAGVHGHQATMPADYKD